MNNYSENLVFIDDFENPKKIRDRSMDCILGIGPFYAKILKKQLKIKKKIKKEWTINFFIKK